MESSNFILLTDSYKVTHHKQYPPGTTKILSYFESRGGKFDHVVFFGLQGIVKKWLTTRITATMIDEAESFFAKHFPYNKENVFNRQGWEHIVKSHNGKLPLVIKAVPEGLRIPVKNVLFTVENTDPQAFWLTNYVETLLVQCWYPMTVCTNSNEQKRLLKTFAELSCDNLATLDTKLHDFGFRGCCSVEAAGIGGAAHLVNFKGTDNLQACLTAQKYYDAQGMMPGISVPASEHSTVTSWGKDREYEAAENMITQLPGPVSFVSDSYDLWNFIENIVGKDLKAAIEKKEAPFILRPDSGDPTKILLETLSKLEAVFHPTINSKGYKVLPDFIRIIQGDGISYETLESITNALQENQWSLDNVTFGSGGALLQKLDRDTQKCAYKCCLATINGQQVDVFKQPITDLGKQSKRGNITLVKKMDGSYATIRREDMMTDDVDMLQEIFKNGHMTHEDSLETIRNRVESEL